MGVALDHFRLALLQLLSSRATAFLERTTCRAKVLTSENVESQMRKEVTQCYTLHILAPLTRMGGCEPTDKSCAGSEAVLVETGLVGSQSRIECQRLSTGACGPVRDSWGSRKHKKTQQIPPNITQTRLCVQKLYVRTLHVAILQMNY